MTVLARAVRLIGVDPFARQTVADHAVFTRTAFERVHLSSPEVLGLVDVERWDSARRQAKVVLRNFHRARADLPWRDRLARRLTRRWEEAAAWLLWYRVPMFQEAEAVGYGLVQALPAGRCSRADDAQLTKLMAIASRRMLSEPLPRFRAW